MAQQIGGQCMAELVATALSGFNTGALDGRADNRRNGLLRSQAADRCASA
jgi:hypothetical protein